jgi:uncharacterized protein
MYIGGDVEFAGFEWDDANRQKCRKHGVSGAEIESLFSGVVFIAPDIAHSQLRSGSRR